MGEHKEQIVASPFMGEVFPAGIKPAATIRKLLKKIREKKHRLDLSLYRGEKVVSFTLCMRYRVNILNTNLIFNKFEFILKVEIQKQDCEAIIYLFMPDHIHLILEGKRETSNVITVVNTFKQSTGFWFHKNMNNLKWQKDYYDHIIRNTKDIRNQIYYILNNPVRSGIAEVWKDYKYKGSTTYNFDE